MCTICNRTPCTALCPNNTQTEEIACPVCGEIMGDTAYVDKDGDILGCENCVTVKNPYN